MKTCSVEGCDKPYKSTGLCAMHYARKLRTGNPLGIEGNPKPALSCKVEGCTNKYRCSGYCGMHYNRWLANGDPGPVGRVLFPAGLTCLEEGCGLKAGNRGRCNVHASRAKREAEIADSPTTRIHAWATVEERLRRVGWTEVIRKPELGACWEWSGLLDKKGYGRVAVGKQKMKAAHRASFEVWNGELDPSLYVCHSCDNPICINPAHLFLGDQYVNMGDAKAKKRSANGMRQGQAKLTDAQVAEIRAKYATGQHSQASLGREYGVTSSNIWAIVNRRNWKTPTNPPLERYAA